MSTAKIIMAGVVLLASGASSAVLWGPGREYVGRGKDSPPPAKSRDEAREPKESPVVQGIGYVEPASDVRNLSFKGGGVIGKCLVEVGKKVRAGDLLMVLDDAAERRTLAVAEQELELVKAQREDVLVGVNKFEITAAEQALEVAKQRLACAEKDYGRAAALIKNRTISQADYDSNESTYRQASAEVRRAEAQLRHLQNYVTSEQKVVAERKVALASAQKDQAAQAIADMRLVAPTDGTVLEILRREGESISSFIHEPVIVFADPSRLRVRAEVDERYVRALKPGQEVTVYGRTLNNKKYRGLVALVKDLMGKRTLFTRSLTERKDLDVVQVFIDMGTDFTAPAGLRVDVAITVGEFGTINSEQDMARK
jgi:HlyD family secretion protein